MNFEELLEKYKNIQTWAIKIYKVQYGLPENSLYIFDYSSSSYNLRSQCDLDIPFVSTEN